MRNPARVVFYLLVGLLSTEVLRAHTVDWLENPYSFFPSSPMVFYYPREFSGHFYVDPTYDEPCTVIVNLNAPTSTLINAQVLPPNPANSVDVLVQILRAPSNHLETATITGEWHATGLPTGFGCDAVNPNPFSVPVTVMDQSPYLMFQRPMNGWINLSGPYSALRFSTCLTGPYVSIGIGQTFSVKTMPSGGFFHLSKEMGKFIGGIVMDNSGTPMSNIKIGLLYGGPFAISDFSGTYSLPRMPVGDNLLAITNPIGASLNIEVANTNNTPTNAYTFAMIKAAMAAAALISPTNICNCTPWCSIGFGTVSGNQTPVYYAGGANTPNGGTPECGSPQVTVTPPVGAPFTIRSGTTHHQNSGPNPASGTWTVTAVVCGQTKTATITVP
ncbi:MAG TPA: hypothetical protein VGO57_13435 [Verrucomicrobiae bacterium]|jgi:hypothetical protein